MSIDSGAASALATASLQVEPLSDRARVATLLRHPLRGRLLALAREPISASDAAARLGETRQKVNYHVRLLARDGFLRHVDDRRRGNLVEHRYVATARAWVLDTAALGDLAPAHMEALEDGASAATLLALAARTQAEVAGVMHAAAAAARAVPTLSLTADVRFESAAQRSAFTEAIAAAVADVVAKHAGPVSTPDGAPAPGRPFRLVLGCYPVPAAASDTSTGEDDAR
jgi:hypothetical protein